MSQRRFTASLYPGKGGVIPVELALAAAELEVALNTQVWLLVQASTGEHEYGLLGESVRDLFLAAKDAMPDRPIALVLDSPGGSARCAYQLATLFRRQCGGFAMLVPRYAKSGATLLALGAQSIILGRFAELGPLDAQIDDPGREERISALDEVKVLERLNAFAMEAIDQQMFLLGARTRRRVSDLLPLVTSSVAAMMRPLFERVDTVQLTRMSRVLKVAEEYATRLLQPKYTEEQAEAIARKLVGEYPDHSFVIDSDEARTIGLETKEPLPEMARLLDAMAPCLRGRIMLGRVEEVTP